MRHMSRKAGEGGSAAVSLFLVHWFLLGTNPGNHPVTWAKRAGHPVLGREGMPRLTNPWEGDPVSHHRHL